MKPNQTKAAGLAQKAQHFSCFQFSERVHCFQESLLLESTFRRAGVSAMWQL